MHEKWTYISFSTSIYSWETGQNPKIPRTTTDFTEVVGSAHFLLLKINIHLG